MPALLKRDALRCLQASCDALALAIAGLAFPITNEKYGLSVSTAPAIGLVGTAAELAIAGCLIQAAGAKAMILSDGRYLSASEAVDKFRAMVRASTAASAFLVQGTPDQAAHRVSLVSATTTFPALFIARAAGLHAGRGLTREACIESVRAVSSFQRLLALSNRLAPYLNDAPKYPDTPVERVILLEDLVGKLSEDGDVEEKARLLRSAFLVLPDVPEQKPDWLEPLARVAIVPTDRDVTLLITALEKALPVQLKRTTTAQGAKSIPVVVRPDDPGALPISPHLLRTEFTKISDQWRSDIANANGRIKANLLDLPPAASVREVFVLGLETTGVLDAGGLFGPHEAWPSVAASLHEHGTPGPYWFLVRRADSHPQLVAHIKKAGELSKLIRSRFDEFKDGISAIDKGEVTAASSQHFRELVSDIDKAEKARAALERKVSGTRGKEKGLPDDLAAEVVRVAQGEADLGPVLDRILKAKLASPAERYWSSRLSEASYEVDDSPALLAVLGTANLSASHTYARKALRLIDFRTHGPPIKPPA